MYSLFIWGEGAINYVTLKTLLKYFDKTNYEIICFDLQYLYQLGNAFKI